MRRIRRAVAALVSCLAIAIPLSLSTASPAAAIGGETFGCRLSPGYDFEWRSFCLNTTPAYQYNAGFSLQNLSGGGYTFSWQISGTYRSIYTGCTSTSSDCALWTYGSQGDSEITVTVTYTQNGQSASQSATAYIRAYCYWGLC